MLIQSLLVGGSLVVTTVIIHFIGVSLLLAELPERSMRLIPHKRMAREALTILSIVLGLVILHALEIWAYAFVYLALGEFHTLESALYFSTASFSTVGYGDVVIESQWRLVAAIEGVNGFVLIGWSTAVLVEVIGQMRAVEERWREDAKSEET